MIKFCANVDGEGKSKMKKKDVELSFWQVLVSTMLSFFGVSNESRRKRDFKLGSPLVFIVSGFVLVLGFIVIVMGAIKWVLALLVG